MSLPQEMKDFVEDIVSSYGSRIESIGSVFDAARELIEGFQDSFLDAKLEREEINARVRDILARNEHLRKRDFDNMMQGILSAQGERESMVRDLLKRYLEEQKATAQALRENLKEFKSSLEKGEADRVKGFRAFLGEISVEQEKRKEEVVSRLKDFRREQKEMAERLRELLGKGRDLRIKDLKSLLREFSFLYRERLVRKEERRKEVLKMIGSLERRGSKWE